MAKNGKLQQLLEKKQRTGVPLKTQHQQKKSKLPERHDLGGI